MNNTPLYSVIVPVFNSEESLVELYNRTSDTFKNLNKSFEIIFIEDSGYDNSWKVISGLAKKHPDNVIAIRLAKNFGQHNAIFCGLNYMNGDFIITLDDDLQIPPEEIEKLISQYDISKADLVYGDFKTKHHSYIRNKGSQILKDSSKKIDNQAPGKGSSFKMFSRNIANNILNHGQNFIYIDEILLWYTKHIDFVSVNHEKRKYQSSNYTLVKLLRLFINISIYYTKSPLKLITYGGIFLSIITFIIGMNFIIRKLIFNVPLGFTAIIVAIMFSTSIILFSLGVIGEYLNRLFIIQNKKPPYSIKTIISHKNQKTETI